MHESCIKCASNATACEWLEKSLWQEVYKSVANAFKMDFSRIEIYTMIHFVLIRKLLLHEFDFRISLFYWFFTNNLCSFKVFGSLFTGFNGSWEKNEIRICHILYRFLKTFLMWFFFYPNAFVIRTEIKNAGVISENLISA